MRHEYKHIEQLLSRIISDIEVYKYHTFDDDMPDMCDKIEVDIDILSDLLKSIIGLDEKLNCVKGK